MEGPTPVSALLHSSTMVTAGYVLFTKYVGFISSNGILPDLIIFLGLFSYLTGVMNSVGSEDGKGALAYTTVAQTGNLFSGTVILSAGFMLLGFVAHGIYKAGSFMAGGSTSLTTPVGQEDEGNESD
jgi:NADH:ubiquinone oxidoreductase subunit 5 (subunit L)/multisubunit Na+/H+ antiporter MnhA subunit